MVGVTRGGGGGGDAIQNISPGMKKTDKLKQLDTFDITELCLSSKRKDNVVGD